MKKILTLLAILTFNLTCFAQAPNWEWGRSARGTSYDYAYGLGIDANRNVYIAGKFMSSKIVFGTDTLTNAGVWDDYLVKYNNAGNELWARDIGGTDADLCNNIAVDASGNIYIAGYFQSTTITFGMITLTNISGDDTYIAKYDSSGNAIWAKNFGSSSTGIYGICADANGNLYVAGALWGSITLGGTTLTSIGAADVLIIKYDTSGNVVWAKSAGGVDIDRALSIGVDANGNSYITGIYTNASITFGSTTLTNNGNEDIFVAKYDPSGNVLWAKGAGSVWTDGVGSIGVNPNGNTYITGYFSASIVFDTDTLYGGSEVPFVVKYDPSGNVKWTKGTSGGGQNQHGIGTALDSNGNVYVAGWFTTPSIDFDGTVLANASGEDIFIAKYDSLGHVIGAQRAGDIWNEFPARICVDPNGNSYITGDYDNSFILGNDTLINYAYSEIFVAKLGSNFICPLVWPGDANNDLIVDNTDLLPIGLNYSASGNMRDSISNAWLGQFCSAWALNQPDSTNMKYADCNGDGIVNSSDTVAVNLNYGSAHTLKKAITSNEKSAPPLFIIPDSVAFYTGDTARFDIIAGNLSNPVNALYGIAYDIHVDPTFIKTGSLKFKHVSSWLGNPASDALTLSKKFESTGDVENAIVRTNHINHSGYGKIGELEFIVNPAIISNDTAFISISYYDAIDSAGQQVPFIVTDTSCIIIPLSISVNELSHQDFSISPNPAHDKLIITASAVQKQTLVNIFNLQGQEMMQAQYHNTNTMELDVSALAKGVYLVKIQSENGVVNKKLVIQ